MIETIKAKKYINFIISILIVSILCVVKNKINKKNEILSEKNNVDEGICIFVQESCIHCHELRDFCSNIDMSKYDVTFYDIGNKKNFDLFLKYAKKHHLSLFDLGTPSIFSDKEYMVGFDRNDHDDEKFMQFLNNNGVKKIKKLGENVLRLPFFGTVNIEDMSLLKVFFAVAIDGIFSVNNLYIFAFLLIICLLFETTKTKLFIQIYFLFLAIMRFLLLTKFLNIAIFIYFIKYVSVLIGWYVIYDSISKLSLSDDEKDGTMFDKLPTSIVFFASILTFIAASIPFIRINKSLGIYMKLIETKDIGNFMYFIYNLLLSILLPLVDFLICFLLFSLLKNINNFKNDLTIIKRFLLLALGIFIIFV